MQPLDLDQKNVQARAVKLYDMKKIFALILLCLAGTAFPAIANTPDEAAVGGRSCFDRTAVQRGSLAHPGDPVPRRSSDRLAHAARENTLAPADVTGATLSISNTGSYGSEWGTPLVIPPQGAILGLGRIAPRALVVDGDVTVLPACTISLGFDHRLLDGFTAGQALTDLVDLLEDPARLRDLPA